MIPLPADTGLAVGDLDAHIPGAYPEDLTINPLPADMGDMGAAPTDTGGKGWWPGLVHHKSITRTWTKYQAKTHLVYLKSIQNFPSQFPCSVPGSGNGWYIHSVPDHVTRVSPSGTPWEHSKFSQRKYPEFS